MTKSFFARALLSGVFIASILTAPSLAAWVRPQSDCRLICRKAKEHSENAAWSWKEDPKVCAKDLSCEPKTSCPECDNTLQSEGPCYGVCEAPPPAPPPNPKTN